MFIKFITLTNYGPFKEKDNTIFFTSCNKLKQAKDTIIKKTHVPLGLIYGANNVGKSCFIEAIKQIKLAQRNEFIEVPEYRRDSIFPAQIEVCFDEYKLSIVSVSLLDSSWVLAKNNKKIHESNSPNLKKFFNDEKTKALNEFLDKIYFLDKSSIIGDWEKNFIIKHIERVNSILRRLDICVEGINIKCQESTELFIKFNNGHECNIDHIKSDSIKTILLMMPLFINDSGYDVFMIDDLLNNLHPVLQEKILESHVIRSDSKKQLIATSNNPMLLNMIDYGCFRPDEVSLVENRCCHFKNGTHRNESDVYSLAEFIRPRRKLNTSQDYFGGHFGAVPFVLYPIP